MSDDLVKRLREGVWGRVRRADAVIQTTMQDAADRLEKQAAYIRRLNTRVVHLEEALDPTLSQSAAELVAEAARKVMGGAVLTDQQKIEVWMVYKFGFMKGLMATARKKGMQEAALRLEELHKNHKYNPQTGEGSEHDTGYYRAISEGVAHIRAAAEEGEP